MDRDEIFTKPKRRHYLLFAQNIALSDNTKKKKKGCGELPV
jgi:hypothetical protein